LRDKKKKKKIGHITLFLFVRYDEACAFYYILLQPRTHINMLLPM
jgi:hypothetical protein